MIDEAIRICPPAQFSSRLRKYTDYSPVAKSEIFFPPQYLFLFLNVCGDCLQRTLKIFLTIGNRSFCIREVCTAGFSKCASLRPKSRGKTILGLQYSRTSTAKHYCRLMYVQSRPRLAGARWESRGEAKRSVPRASSTAGSPPIGEIVTSRALERCFSADRVARDRTRAFPSSNKSVSLYGLCVHGSWAPWLEAQRSISPVAPKVVPRSDRGMSASVTNSVCHRCSMVVSRVCIECAAIVNALSDRWVWREI